MNRRTELGGRHNGFTLAELAITIAIIGLLLGGAFATMSTQMELRQILETRRTIEQAREALYGYALANGRLPCPAAPSPAGGVESPLGGGVCTHAYNGFLPGATLGLTPTDSAGYVLDAWSNRIRYAVTTSNTSAFTTSNQIRTLFSGGTLAPDLNVCSTSTGMTGTTCAPAALLVTSAVAVIFSTGKNTSFGGTGADEAENLNNNLAFVYHEQTASGSTNGEFDDIFTWVSPNVLYARMASAGSL